MTRTLSAIFALMILSFLTSCAGVNFNSDAKLIIPDVVEYSKDTQIKAADELEGFEVPTLTELMKDYHVMRKQARRASSR